MNTALNAQNNKLVFLESLRGLAALYVVIHHARWFLWAGYSKGYLKHPEEFNIWNKILMYSFSFFVYGHEMVIFFFILSGFVIHLKYAKALYNNNLKFDLLYYLKKRFIRIYPPLVFAILFTFIIDSIGKYHLFPIYSVNTPFKIVKDNFTLATLIGNCLFLMNTYVDTWGSDFALWSLKFEWWFYMLYPVFFLIVRKSIFLAFLIITVLYALSYFPGLWPNKLLQSVFSSMIIWWLGVILADIYVGRIKINMKYLIPFLFIIPLILLLKFTFMTAVQDFLWGLGFLGGLAVLFTVSKKGISLKILNKFSWLGGFSYSLYLTHMPILVFMSGFLLKRDGSLPLNFNNVILGTVICLVFAWAVHYLIEKPFITSKGVIGIPKT